MSDYKKGDRVKVTIEGEVSWTGERGIGMNYSVIVTDDPSVTVERLPEPERWEPGDVVRDAEERVARRMANGGWDVIGPGFVGDDHLTRPLTRLVPEPQQPVYRVGDPDPTPKIGAPQPRCYKPSPSEEWFCHWPKGHEHPQHVAGTGREVIAVWPVDGVL